jgi:hypothetical protein
MRTRDDYERAIAVTAAILREWDPYCLLEGGAPLDEFDGEIAKVVAQIPRMSNASDAAHAVSQVFAKAFEPEVFTPTACTDIGERLYASLVRAGLVPTPDK